MSTIMNTNHENELQRVGYFMRKEKISAGHRLISKHLSAEENKKIYGKCYNPNGHGHNYTVTVTVKGKVDPITGLVIFANILSGWMKKACVEPLDHMNLNTDVPFFKDRPTSTENIAVFVWQQMKAVMSDPTMLYEVKVKNTDKNFAMYRGETM